MQFLDLVEIQEWRTENGGIRAAPDWEIPDNPALIYGDTLRYPTDSARDTWSVPVTNACLRVLGPWDECLLWVTVVGVHSYWEDWPAFYALRGEDGERNSLGEKPGHRFIWYERNRFATYLEAAVNNLWDAWVLPVSHGQPEMLRLRVSHDSCVDLWSRTPRKFPKLHEPSGHSR